MDAKTMIERVKSWASARYNNGFVPSLSVHDVAKIVFFTTKATKEQVKEIREIIKTLDVYYNGQSVCFDTCKDGKHKDF